MYKVAIIDDEPIIVEGITRMISWEKYNCIVVAAAYDGTTGMDVIREKKPNILITDISMPGKDGLAMIAGLKSEFPHLMTSILTGYRDFDYAQEAIRLGVVRFMLKPSNMEEIEEAIETMTARLKAMDMVLEEESELEDKPYTLANSFITNNAIKYIEDHYNHKLTLAEVAEKTYISQWHLSKLLNNNLGQNFSEILNGIRIREAKKLLTEPSLRIGEIAEMVGFSDMAHFSRVFKKVVGISANEYRNSITIMDIEKKK